MNQENQNNRHVPWNKGKLIGQKSPLKMQQKTHRPVQFEITEQTRDSLANWIGQAQLKSDESLFSSRIHNSRHLSTRQYARIVEHWVVSIGLDPAAYGTHTMRRTKSDLSLPSNKKFTSRSAIAGSY